jgi:hypothetical protein
MYYISYYYYYIKNLLDTYIRNNRINRNNTLCANMLENKGNIDETLKDIKIPDSFMSDSQGDLIEIRKIIDIIEIDRIYKELESINTEFDRKTDIEKILNFLIKERDFNMEYDNINKTYLNHENSQNNVDFFNKLIFNFTLLRIILKKLN